MTYFGFLAQFVGLPILILSVIALVDYRRGVRLPDALAMWRPSAVIAGLCAVAFIYTTPWDNYLVATGVWWYDIDLVSGIVFGWVPIEEYTFFLLQPVMSGLFLLLLMRYIPARKREIDSSRVRWVATLAVAVVWAISTGVLILTGTNEALRPATYLTLELSWALIPVMLQLAFGADILLRHWRYVLPSLVITTLYLSWADSLAISAGTWTIDPAQSLGIMIGGVLPLEEFVFFLLTNVLITFGITLILARESQTRALSLERYSLLRPLVRWLKRIKPDMQTGIQGAS